MNFLMFVNFQSKNRTINFKFIPEYLLLLLFTDLYFSKKSKNNFIFQKNHKNMQKFQKKSNKTFKNKISTLSLAQIVTKY